MKLKSAWLVLWSFRYDDDGIKIKESKLEPISDILCSRIGFDKVKEFAKTMYISRTCNLAEKMQFADYRKSNQNIEEWFEVNLAYSIHTHYTHKLYSEHLTAATNQSEDEGYLHSVWRDRFQGHEYIEIDGNPIKLEIRKVHNLEIKKDSTDKQHVFWEQKDENGDIIQKSLEI